MALHNTHQQTEFIQINADTLTSDKISNLAEVSKRRGVSVTFLRKEIERGRLRAIVLAPNSHRKKVRVFYRDELSWLESNVA